MSRGMRRIDEFLSHTDLEDVQFEGRTFRYKGRVVPGLLNPLRRSLWPGYNYEKANTGSSRRFAKRDASVRRPWDGRKRGSRVHAQIETLTTQGTASIKKSRRGLDAYTRKFLLALRAWKWMPVLSEVAVYDPTMGIATKFDLLCVDEKGRLVLVETKTGYYVSWNRGVHTMNGPFYKPISDSPCNQSLVQLMFTKRMLQNYGLRVERAYVVRVDPDGVYPYRLPRELERNARELSTFVRESEDMRRSRA